jgi:hypothetical protein
MALITCSECGRQISTAATACPGCGAPVTKVNPPPSPAVPPPLLVAKTKSKSLWVWLAAVVGVLLFAACLCVFVIRASIVGRGSDSSAESRIRDTLVSALQEKFGRDKQQRYEKIHLAGELGQAKNDVIQDVSIQWKDGRPTDNAADIAVFTVDHTLYWQTPLTKDGYTRFTDTYDCSSGTPQLTNSKIVATNGITVEGATNALIEYGARELTKAISDMVNGTPAPDSKP